MPLLLLFTNCQHRNEYRCNCMIHLTTRHVRTLNTYRVPPCNDSSMLRRVRNCRRYYYYYYYYYYYPVHTGCGCNLLMKRRWCCYSASFWVHVKLIFRIVGLSFVPHLSSVSRCTCESEWMNESINEWATDEWMLSRGLNRRIWLDDLFLRLRKRNFS